MKRGKKYQEAIKGYDRLKKYPISEAAELNKKLSFTKFDATVELALKTNLNPKKAEQNIRGSINLPHGTGKTKKICVICDDVDVAKAKGAGADFVGNKELLEKIQGGWLEFDVMLATPKMMPQLGRLGKILGPRGLMPNPKTGTVTQDIEKTVGEFKKGKVEFSVDRLGNIQVPIGLISFDGDKITENAITFVQHILKLRPNTLKGKFISNVTLSSTMGPGIKLDIETLKENKQPKTVGAKA